MPRLDAVQSGLSTLRRFRAAVRLGSAWAAFGSVFLGGLLAAFLLDCLLHTALAERAVMLGALLAAGAWAGRRFLLPAHRVREDDVALALLVERRQGISSDIVAALQFADGTRAQHGSGALREAVIDCTAEVAGGLDFLEGFSRRQLWRRGLGLAAVGLLLSVPVLAYPGHARAFFGNRLFLGGARYPTDTLIRQVLAPGERAAFGRPLLFQVRVEGVRPPTGRAELRALGSGLTTSLDLKPDPADPGLYRGQLQRVTDDLEYTLHLGDAETDPRRVAIIPLPRVELDLEVVTPSYAKDFKPERISRSQVTALAGSRVVPRVRADKPLRSAVVQVEEQRWAMRPAGDGWVLDDPASPLASLTESLRFAVHVVDADDLSPESPATGSIQVRSDRGPRVDALAATRYVLPGAVPVVSYVASDDHALGRIVLRQTLRKAGADAVETTTTLLELGGRARRVEASRRAGATHAPLEFRLEPLGLAVGDQVTLVLEAHDYRGSEPGEVAQSDPVTFEVADLARVLRAVNMDEEMDTRLDQIIQTHLGIGERP